VLPSLRSLLVHAAALLLGGLAAEVVLRAPVTSEKMFGFCGSRGLHTPDDELGFVFTPEGSYHWFHEQHAWAVPFRLDEYGCRPVARSPRAGEPLEVLLLGGRSQVGGFGLPDDETLHHHLAEVALRPLEVRAVAWPGVDLYRSWRFYARELQAEASPDVVLVCLNPISTSAFAELIPADLRRVPPHPLGDDLFTMAGDFVYTPASRLQEWLGPDYFRSYVGYGLMRHRGLARRRLAAGLERLPGLEGVARRIAVPADEPPAWTTRPEDPESGARGLRRLEGFLEHLQGHFAEQGAIVAVVYLPSMVAEEDCYASVDRAVPASMARFDLHRELYGAVTYSEGVADGHYSAAQSELIARRLDALVEELLAPPPLARRAD